jgi:tetratricopeptide (TPR) repeat protein
MAKVYVSSTVADLEAERRAVMDWLVKAGHQPVHSYQPDSETVRESCLQDVDGCDLYVLILGHRYGFQPEADNPEKLSITQLEFRRAGESHIPRIALLRTSVPDIRLSDLLDPVKAAQLRAFEEEVRRAVRPAEFSDVRGLIEGLSTGVPRELDKLRGQPAAGPSQTRILEIVAKLTDENLTLRGQVQELQEQLKAAVARTLAAAAQPGAGENATAAAEALEAGDTRPAEALLASQERDEAGRIGARGADDERQRKEAAALARQQGALAMGHDVRAALAAYQRAAAYEPDDTWTLFFIGDLEWLVGDGKAAMQSFERGRAVAEALVARDPDNSVAQHDLGASHERIGNILAAQGDTAGALVAYRKRHEIAEALAQRDPADTDWQRDLSVSHEKIGNMLATQGDTAGALAAYRKSLEIREALAGRDPANAQWQRDLSVSHEKIGNMLAAQGDTAGALAAYRKSLEIREALAGRDPANTEWQRDLSVSHNKIGDMLAAQGDTAGALAAHRKSLEIAEALAGRDPANTEWQRDLSVSHDKIGNMLAKQGDTAGALAAYRKSLEIREALAGRDPPNTQLQRDLSVSHNKIGDMLAAQGDTAGALAAYRKSLKIRNALAGRDPANTEWQRDLSVSHNSVGDMLEQQGDTVGALAAHRKSLEIAESLAGRDPANAQWQIDLSISFSKLAELENGEDVKTRLDYLRRGRAILATLKKEGRLPQSQDWIAWFDKQIGKLEA